MKRSKVFHLIGACSYKCPNFFSTSKDYIVWWINRKTVEKHCRIFLRNCGFSATRVVERRSNAQGNVIKLPENKKNNTLLVRDSP